MNTPILSVAVITYNHEKYIEDCLESLVTQKVDYPYEIIIGEDCSTDNTLKYVKKYADKYPDLIRLIVSENNVGAMENDRRVMAACKGKYIAYCEGDDFWVDEYKLQKQIDFLEQNTDYGMVHTDFEILNEGRNQKSSRKRLFRSDSERPTGDILEFIVKTNHVGTASVCLRRDLFEASKVQQTVEDEDWGMSDYPTWIELAAVSKIHYMPDITSSYRVHKTSLTHGLNWEGRYKFYKCRFDVKKYYVKKFKLEKLLPFINDMYYRELLKYAIFMKNEDMRAECLEYYKKNKGFALHKFFAKYSFLDGVFRSIYNFYDYVNILS